MNSFHLDIFWAQRSGQWDAFSTISILLVGFSVFSTKGRPKEYVLKSVWRFVASSNSCSNSNPLRLSFLIAEARGCVCTSACTKLFAQQLFQLLTNPHKYNKFVNKLTLLQKGHQCMTLCLQYASNYENNYLRYARPICYIDI